MQFVSEERVGEMNIGQCCNLVEWGTRIRPCGHDPCVLSGYAKLINGRLSDWPSDCPVVGKESERTALFCR